MNEAADTIGRRPRVALTGATGFLGSHIADALLDAGYDVRASIRPTSSLQWITGKPIQPVQIDLTDVEGCSRLVAGCEAVVHCAGVVSGADEAAFHTGNVATTEALLEATHRTSPRSTFVLISSLAAHGPAPLSAPAVEDAPDHPITAYGRSKLAAERLILDAPPQVRPVVLRPPSLYGPRDRDFLPLFKAAERGWTARLGRCLTGLSLVDGRDAAAAVVAALGAPRARGIYYLDDGREGYSLDEMTRALAQAVRRSVRTVFVPLALLKLIAALAGRTRAARSPVLNRDRLNDLAAVGWVCAGRKLAEDTGYRPERNAFTGFAETATFYREVGWA